MKRLLLVLVLVTAAGAGCAPGFTRPATDVTATTATLNGDVASSVGGTVQYRFDWGPTTEFGSSAGGEVETEKDVKEPVSLAIEGLEPQTLYYFRVCGNDDGRDVCSKPDTFTTLEEHSVAEVHRNTLSGNWILQFNSGRHRQNRLSVRTSATAFHYIVTDTRSAANPNQGSFIDPGAGCSQIAPDSVECRSPTHPFTQIGEFYANLGDEDDEFDNVDVNLSGVFGASGDSGDDVLRGSSDGEEFSGGPGVDHMFGGAGTDILYANDGEPDGTIDCGQGGEVPPLIGDTVWLDIDELDAHTDINCETRNTS